MSAHVRVHRDARIADPVAAGERAPTAAFCAQALEGATEPLPAAVRHAASRSLLNVLGTAVGASQTQAVEVLLATAREDGAGPAIVPGRAETVNAHWGALVVGTAAHLDDFDDTHLDTVIHPGAAALAVILALQPESRVDGARFLSAFARGCEAQLRIGLAISPEHYDRGWHITGTCGVFGAAVGAAVLLGLDAGELQDALALASLMVLGHREAFGSMAKPFHAGKAASNGVFAARLAAAGVKGFADPLRSGAALRVLARQVDEAQLLRTWDGAWELEHNTFKPYPCGIVAHPLIDAAKLAAARLDLPESITAVDVRCNPLVPELMGRRQPEDGLQARFSAVHATATALIDGQVGLEQFSDERAAAADVRRLRELTTLMPDPACPRDTAAIRVTLANGTATTFTVAHARGSLARPLDDAELFAKVDRLIEPVLGPGAANAVAAAVDQLHRANDMSEIAAAVRPR